MSTELALPNRSLHLVSLWGGMELWIVNAKTKVLFRLKFEGQTNTNLLRLPALVTFETELRQASPDGINSVVCLAWSYRHYRSISLHRVNNAEAVSSQQAAWIFPFAVVVFASVSRTLKIAEVKKACWCCVHARATSNGDTNFDGWNTEVAETPRVANPEHSTSETHRDTLYHCVSSKAVYFNL